MIVNTGRSLKDQFRRVTAFIGPRFLGLSFSRLGNLSLVLEPTTLNSRKALPGVFTPYGHHGCFEIEHPTAAPVTVKTLKSSKAPTNYFTPNILRKSWSRLVVSVVHLDALAFPVAAT